MINPIDSAFSEIRNQCGPTVIFSANWAEATQAEKYYLLSKRLRTDAAETFRGSCTERAPEPVRSYSSHPEESLLIFADGSFLSCNNAGTEVWSDYSDYLATIEIDTLPLGMREFFGIESPEDSEAVDFVVNIETFFYGVSNSEALAAYECGQVLAFPTRAEAAQWVIENWPDKNELYRCAHNEYASPVYTVFAR